MSQSEIYERNWNGIDSMRIICSTLPWSDKPTIETDQYMFFEHGTYQCYDLFRSEARINTFKSLKWHLLVLWWLNPQVDQDGFQELAEFITNKYNGFCTFGISPTALERIVHDVSMSDLDEPPKNKARKVIFKRNCNLSKAEKLSIVGQLIGRSKKISPDDIYDCMIMINHNHEKITIKRISDMLGCTSRTVHRNMPNELKREKELLNNELSRLP